MKKRFGFVSNSSSSSFVIAFPKDAEINEDTVAKVVFPDDPYLTECFMGYDDNHVMAKEAVSSILDQMKETGVANKETIARTVHQLTYGDVPPFLSELAEEEPDYQDILSRQLTSDERRVKWDEYNKAHDDWRAKVVNTMIDVSDKQGKVWYVVEYGDDSRFGSVMEHEGVFDSVITNGNAIRINNH